MAKKCHVALASHVAVKDLGRVTCNNNTSKNAKEFYGPKIFHNSIMKFRMDALHYALLAVLVLLVFYFASTYGVFKQRETANNSVSRCDDVKDKKTCNNSTSKTATELYGPGKDGCMWYRNECKSVASVKELKGGLSQQSWDDKNKLSVNAVNDLYADTKGGLAHGFHSNKKLLFVTFKVKSESIKR